MKVSIIVVNYNTSKVLKNCLDSIFKNTFDIDFEVVVVDNDSEDGSQQMIINDFPQVVLIESSRNLGFGKANNLGVINSKGEFLFLLNSDTILLNNAVKYFYDFFQRSKNKCYSIAGSILLDSNLEPVHSSGRFPSQYSALKDVFFNYLKRSRYLESNKERLFFGNDSCFEVDYITGADLFVPKKVFNLVGGFDPIFFMYYEDSELQKRMQKLGLKRVIIKGPKIIHLEGGSNLFPVFSSKRRVMVTESLFKYFKKHSNPLSFLFFKWSYFILRLPILFDRRIKFTERIHYLYSIIN